MVRFNGIARPGEASGRLESIQVLRALAALAVVYNHAVNLLVYSPELALTGSVLGPNEAVGQIGAIGVDLFFVISGFVMTLGARRLGGAWDAMRFLVLRWVRIAPLFYFFSLVLLVGWFRAGSTPEADSLLNTLMCVPVFDDDEYSWPIHYLGWTLAFEFVFYLFVAGAITGRLRAVAAPLLALLVALPVAGYLLEPSRVLWRIATSPMMWEFALGVGAFLLFASGALARLRPWLAPAAGIALVWVAVGIGAWPEGFSRVGEDVVEQSWRTTSLRALYWGLPMFVLFLAFVGHGVGGGRGHAARLFRYLGDASYSIYLAHLLVVERMVGLLEGIAIEPDLAIVLAVVSSVVAGVLCYRWVETPALAIGRRWVDRWLGVSPARPPRRSPARGGAAE